MIPDILANSVEIPVGWMLTAILGLGGTIATLAGLVFRILTCRLDAQDRIIEHLKMDIVRMAGGCGIESCHWRKDGFRHQLAAEIKGY